MALELGLVKEIFLTLWVELGTPIRVLSLP